VDPGWVQVTEKTLFADGKGYGWSTGTVASRDRGTGTRLRQDFNFSRDAVFSVEVLDGSYSVTITMGDAAAALDHLRKIHPEILEGDPELLSLPECLQELGVFQQSLRGNAASVEARPPQIGLFHYDRTKPELGRANGGNVAGRPATQHCQVISHLPSGMPMRRR
jgi:hypothetical protein